jgi:hypothetical protein
MLGALLKYNKCVLNVFWLLYSTSETSYASSISFVLNALGFVRTGSVAKVWIVIVVKLHFNGQKKRSGRTNAY